MLPGGRQLTARVGQVENGQIRFISLGWLDIYILIRLNMLALPLGDLLGSCTWPSYNYSTASRPSGRYPSIRVWQDYLSFDILKTEFIGDPALPFPFFTAQQRLSQGGGFATMKEREEERINGRMDNKSPTSGRVLLTGMFANSWNEYGTFVRAFTTIGHPSNLASSLIYSGHLQMYRRQRSPPLSLSWQGPINNVWELCIQHSSQYISWVFNNVYSLPRTPFSITVRENRKKKKSCPSLRQVNKHADNGQENQAILTLFECFI